MKTTESGQGSGPLQSWTRRAHTLLLCAVLLVLAGCSGDALPQYRPEFSKTPPANTTPYVFAPHPRLNPQKLAETYGAVLDLVNQRLAAEHITLKLETSRSYAAFNEKLLRRQVHFALPNPYETVLAQDCGYKIFGKTDNDDDFRGIILLRKDSPITTVQGLKGATVSFPAPTALAATMMPELYLQEHGVNPQKDIHQIFVGTHDSAMMNVCIGTSVAVCTSPAAWQGFQRERPDQARLIEVRWRTDPLPNNGLVVRNDVPERVQRLVAEAFFSLRGSPEGQRILRLADAPAGFVPADNATFAPVYDFIRRYEHAVHPLKGLHE